MFVLFLHENLSFCSTKRRFFEIKCGQGSRMVRLLKVAFVGLIFVLTASAASTNDFFAQRILLAGPTILSTANFTGATREPGEPHNAGQSLWWEWTAPATGAVAVEVLYAAGRSVSWSSQGMNLQI
jgi:hypothetical protein